MEEVLLAQVRGLLVMANARYKAKDKRLYLYYLNRAKDILILVENMRQQHNLKAA